MPVPTPEPAPARTRLSDVAGKYEVKNRVFPTQTPVPAEPEPGDPEGLENPFLGLPSYTVFAEWGQPTRQMINRQTGGRVLIYDGCVNLYVRQGKAEKIKLDSGKDGYRKTYRVYSTCKIVIKVDENGKVTGWEPNAVPGY